MRDSLARGQVLRWLHSSTGFEGSPFEHRNQLLPCGAQCPPPGRWVSSCVDNEKADDDDLFISDFHHRRREASDPVALLCTHLNTGAEVNLGIFITTFGIDIRRQVL